MIHTGFAGASLLKGEDGREGEGAAQGVLNLLVEMRDVCKTM